MAKKIYVVKGYEEKGKDFRRSTDRDYTHAVVVKRSDGLEFVAGYCSRLELAQKLERSTLVRFEGDHETTTKIYELIRIK
jgi:hypothetical protein